MDPFAAADEVQVEGGSLHVARAGPRPADAEAVVVAAHGITASHVSWRGVARELLERRPELCMLAPDLRGRGRSAWVAPPGGGFTAHVSDLVAVLDHAGVERAVLAGHSIGAFVTARAAVDHPERASALVLVDGGLRPVVPQGVSPNAALDALLGPAIERTRMTINSPEDYVEHWKQHPAFAGRWSEDVEDFVRYDLGPDGRSVLSEDAVRADGAELLMDGASAAAAAQVQAPLWLLRAPRGMRDDNPFVSLDALLAFKEAQPRARIEEVPDVNHYTLVLGEGAPRVAAALEAAVDQS